jgi:hypothetical protein
LFSVAHYCEQSGDSCRGAKGASSHKQASTRFRAFLGRRDPLFATAEHHGHNPRQVFAVEP